MNDDLGRLTYRDLLELRIVNNRGTLRNWILRTRFPARAPDRSEFQNMGPG